MVDTAQPLAAETDDRNLQIEEGANAFKAAFAGDPVPTPRDDKGRFAATAEPEPDEEIEAEPGQPGDAENDDEPDEGEEAAEEAQPDAIEMPSSWNKDQAEHWQTLPPETQAYIAEREGERDRAVNQKFQEAANLRREMDSRLGEANANRDNYAAAIDEVFSLVAPQEPDPTHYGAGTGNYDRERFDLDTVNYKRQVAILNQLQQQRQTIAAQQASEAEEAEAAARAPIEEEWRPRFIAAVPDIMDPQKGGPVLQGLAEYAVANGIPASLFMDEKQVRAITSAELLLIHKAKAYDDMQAARTKVKETPAPKPATPTVRPGTVTPRSAQRKTAFAKASDRLAREGSIEAGAAIFKHFT